MNFSSSRWMKSLGSLGRTKPQPVDADMEAPSDMSGRLARVREAALANEAQTFQPTLPAAPSVDGTEGEQAEGAQSAGDALDATMQPAVDEQALDGAVASLLKHLKTGESDATTHNVLGSADNNAEEDSALFGNLAATTPRDSNGHLATIKWLASQDTAVWHYIASEWDWDWGVEPLMWMVKQSDCDAGTAAMLFWKSGVDEHYLPFGDAEPTEDHDILVAELAEKVAARFAADEFGPMLFAFDEALVQPHFPSRLDELYADERIEWDATKVPYRSTGELVLIDRFDSATEEEILRILSDELAQS